MPQDVHHQLARVGVGQVQYPAAVGLEAPALLRVPGLRRHPARTLGAEAQLGPLHLPAGKDAVAGASTASSWCSDTSIAGLSSTRALRIASTAKLRMPRFRWQQASRYQLSR